MPAHIQTVDKTAAQKLAVIGQQIRSRRKALKINATVAAEAAGVSRVTLHRIERGEPSVTSGAYVNALTALGLDFGIIQSALTPPGASPEATSKIAPDAKAEPTPNPPHWIPARVRLADYPQLKQLAWQVHGTDELTPAEALGIYERNARHLDAQALEPSERNLIDALRLALGNAPSRH